jgi:hypothetical protein
MGSRKHFIFDMEVPVLNIFKTAAGENRASIRKRISEALMVNRQGGDMGGNDGTMARIALLLFCLFWVVAGAQAQAKGAASEGTAVPEAVREQLLKLVPDPLPAQAHSLGAPALYASNLWEYLDGEADQFLVYGMDGMLHQEFQAGEVNVTMDIFSLGQPENAFGKYASDRAAGAQFIPIGTEGYHSQTSDGTSTALNYFQDRYYVKLVGFGKGGDAVLQAFARGIASRIGTSPAWPSVLAQLPAAHRVPHTEKYILANPLGHDFLSPAYLVKYETDKNENTLVVSVAADEADALRRLEQLEKHLRQEGQCAAAPAFGEHAIRGKTSYEGEIVAGAVGRYLVLMVNPSGSAEELFRETVTRLK